MKIFLVAGEASGDTHAAALARAILKQQPDAQLLGMGGRRMAEAGVEIVKSIDDMQIMGFVEVLQNLSHIKSVFRQLEARYRQEQPDALILVDYPGFNLRFARAVRDAPGKILYYISPQVWAWHRSRLKQMRRVVDRMLVLFDFEVPFYEVADVPVEFVGHPLVDQLDQVPDGSDVRRELSVADERPLIALLPGSRLQEVQRILPPMIAAAKGLGAEHDPAPTFVVAVPPQRPELEQTVRSEVGEQATVVVGRTHEVVRAADLAWVSSGTATLETALLDTPLICCYRGSTVSYALASLIVDLPCISLVNIVAGRPAVPELVQSALRSERLVGLSRELLANTQERERMRDAFADIRRKLGGPGGSVRAAEAVLQELR